MSSHLVQKTITDKNGVVSTRWVKPENSPSSSTVIPAVNLTGATSASDRQSVLNMITDRFEAYSPHDFDVAGTTTRLAYFSYETLAVITAELEKEDSEDRISQTSFWITVYADRERLLREVLYYWDAFDPSTDYNFVDESISHLHELKSLPQIDDYSKADPELQKIITDVLSTTESLYSEEYELTHGEGTKPVLSEALCRLVMDRPDEFDRINDIILDHGVRDAEQIEMILDSDTQSLRGGIL